MVETRLVSDAVDIDKSMLMDRGFAYLTICLDELDPDVAFAVAQQIGVDRLEPHDRDKIGDYMAGEDVEFNGEVTFHFDVSSGMMILQNLGIVEFEQPEQDPEEQLEEIGDDNE